MITRKHEIDLISGDCGTGLLLYMTESRLCPQMGVCTHLCVCESCTSDVDLCKEVVNTIDVAQEIQCGLFNHLLCELWHVLSDGSVSNWTCFYQCQAKSSRTTEVQIPKRSCCLSFWDCEAIIWADDSFVWLVELVTGSAPGRDDNRW